MEHKAYSPKLLMAKLRAQGIVIAEDAAEVLVNGTFDWLEESAKLSENKIDDMLSVGYPHARGLALAQVDKIDGKVG